MKKSKIDQINVWIDSYGIPNSIQFFYKDQNNFAYEGTQPIENLPQSLTLKTFKMTEGDYLNSIEGEFLESELSSVTFKSKFGKEMTFRN